MAADRFKLEDNASPFAFIATRLLTLGDRETFISFVFNFQTSAFFPRFVDRHLFLYRLTFFDFNRVSTAGSVFPNIFAICNFAQFPLPVRLGFFFAIINCNRS